MSRHVVAFKEFRGAPAIWTVLRSRGENASRGDAKMKAKFLRGWFCVLLLPAMSFAATPASTTVVDAVKNADKAALKTLLQQKANVKLPEPDGTTALHWAVFNNDPETVDLLLAAGAD